MTEDFSNLKGDEQLKAENDFLKMKLMLEKGAHFGVGSDDTPLPPQIENQFLHNILKFEEQMENPVITTVYDRLNKPTQFKPVTEIPDDRIEEAWEELSDYLLEHSIRLDVCSPNISSREMYRFATEEFFKIEMNVVDIPGMMNCFIYDEFHPDPVYETSRLVEHSLFGDIFSKTKLFYEIYYGGNGFTFNNKSYSERKDFIEIIDRFKSLHNSIKLDMCHITQCIVNEGT